MFKLGILGKANYTCRRQVSVNREVELINETVGETQGGIRIIKGVVQIIGNSKAVKGIQKQKN